MTQEKKADQWGVGDQADSKPFGTAVIGEGEHKRTVELIWGEHPHSRQDKNIYARFPGGHIEPFDGHRVQWKIELETYNYLKESGLSGNEVRQGGTLSIYRDGVQVASVFFRDPAYGLRKAERLLIDLQERWPHGEPETWVGRKVYYREIPAVITAVILDQGCYILATESGEPFPKAPWQEDGEEEREVKVEMFSPHIWWWRE